PEAVTLSRELGLDAALVSPATSRAYLWIGGRLCALPQGLSLGVPTRLRPLARSRVLSPAGLARAALDVLSPTAGGGRAGDADDVPVGEVVGRRLGHEVVDRLADPLIGGIHAGGVEHMSAAAVFPMLLQASKQPGSLMRNLRRTAPPATADGAPVFGGFEGGMSRLVEALVQALRRDGAEIHTVHPVLQLEHGHPAHQLEHASQWKLHGPSGPPVHADALVVATRAPSAAELLRPHSRRLADLLDSIPHAGVVLATMRFAREDVGRLPPGSGFLVPRRSGGVVTACTWMSAKWAHLARPDDVLVRASLGRFGDERALAMDDDEVVRRATAELTAAMALRRGPGDATVARFGPAFPQYAVGHLSTVAAIEHEAQCLGGLALAGSYLGGVGIPACIDSGRRAAHRAGVALGEAARR
ncbi:MAG TPA: protoporphyrinogen oxidase, partial [Acidimicrobiales bacterium]|nr:protoporphyrinogen oxidase [Acidimicrobiales bacterium]